MSAISSAQPEARSEEGSPVSLLSVRELKVSFPTDAGLVQAVRDVSFEIHGGETVGLVGESGCGKSTLGRALMRLVPSAGGQIVLQGHDLTLMSVNKLRPLRPLMQMIFQDPYGSINPRNAVGKTIGQPLSLAGWTSERINQRVGELLLQVGLPASAAQRFPHEFSGGQRQRIGIARALALHPQLLICDEPVSALDVSVRAQIINLLRDLQRDLGVAYLFISHDLSVVRHVCDRVLVMYLGRLVEVGDTETLWRRPAHPYTRALLSAAPIADPRQRAIRRREVLQGELPSPLRPPSGCVFRSRCQFAQPRCSSEQPELRQLAGGQQVACHFDLVTDAPEMELLSRPMAIRPALETVDSPASTDLSHLPSGVPSMTDLKNLGDLVDRTLDPARLAVVDLYDPSAPREHSHGDMDLMAGGVAQFLTSRGIPRGARVAILALNRVEYIAAYFGIMRAGMVAVPVNTKLPAETIAHVLKDADVSLAFVDTVRRQVVAQAVPIIDFDDAGPEGFGALVRPASFESVVPHHDDVAQILYTSGSTGMPKGVPLTHAGQLWALCKPLLPGAKDERQIVAQPLFHMNGLMVTKGVFRAGASMVLMPAFDTRAYTEALARYRVTSVMAVPTMFARVIKEMEGRNDIDLSCLWRIHLASAPITVTMLERIQQAIPCRYLAVKSSWWTGRMKTRVCW